MTQDEAIGWTHDGVPLAGTVVRPAGTGPFPAVLVFAGAAGGERRTRMTVTALAERGYIAVAASMYDARIDTRDEANAGAQFMALQEQPALLRDRARGWFDRFAALSGVVPSRLATLGYCFGGLCVLEIARSGAKVQATVAYHGLLRTHAPAQPGAIAGRVVAWCAGQDPYAPHEDTGVFEQEMINAGVRHQITVFSDAQHAFTDPDAAMYQSEGIAFDPLAEAVSWAGTLALLEQCLGD